MSARREYVAAYRAANGNVIAVGDTNAVLEYAEVDVRKLNLEEWRLGGRPDAYFAAFRDLPDWEPVDAAAPIGEEP